MSQTTRTPALITPALFIAFGAHGLHGVNLGLYTLVPVFVRDELGGNVALAGLLGGLAYGAGILARPLAGPLLDGVGRRTTIWGAGVLAVFAACLYLFIDELGPLIYVARILSGLADGMLFTAYFTYAADVVPPERRVQGLAVFGLSGLIPMSLAPWIGEWLIDHHGFPAMFWALVAATSGSLLVSFFLPEPDDESKSAQPDPARASQGARLTPSLVLLCAFAAVLGLCLCCALNFVPPAAREAGTRIASFTIAYGALAAIVRLGGLNIPDRLGAATVAGPAMVIYGGGLFVLALSRSTAALIVAGACGGLGHGLAFPALAALGAQAAPMGKRGTILALLTGLMDLFIFIPAWPLGAIADVERLGYRALFAVAGALTLLLALGWVLGVVVPGLRALRRADHSHEAVDFFE